MNRRSKFFQSAYHVKPIDLPSTFNECDVTPIIDQNEVAVLCPITEHGLVGDVLSRALRASSPEMQNSLLSLLSDNGITPDTRFSSLDDDIRMNLVKLRTCQSPSEVKAYYNALSSYFDSVNVSERTGDGTGEGTGDGTGEGSGEGTGNE